MSDRAKITMLYITSLVFALPFLCGVIFLFLSSMGVTPVWQTTEFGFSHFLLVLQRYVSIQFLYAFIRMNIIAFLLLCSVYVAGYIILKHKKNGFIATCIYLLSIPHVSLAVGIGFLIMPTGLLFRLFALITNSSEVYDVVLINDRFGIAMSVVVLLKIVPFLVFMMLGHMQDYYLQYQVLQSKVLGHNSVRTWTFIVFPQILPKIIMPFFISIVYALVPIDIATVIGPQNPSSIGMMIEELLVQTSRDKYIDAHVLSVVLLGISFLSLVMWYGIFACIQNFLRKGYTNPHAFFIRENSVSVLGYAGVVSYLAITVVAMIILVCWSFIVRWDYPSLIPNVFSISHLKIYMSQFFHSITNTLLIALLSTAFSLCISLFVLECLHVVSWKHEYRILSIFMLPLLVPTIIYISGARIFFLFMNIDGTLFAMVWAHTLRTVPYMTLLLYGTIKGYNSFHVLQGRVLGKSYYNTLITIKFPMMITPLFYASVISMLVSVAEYVSTQFIGNGLWVTITTLTISLYSGGDRQVMSFAGVLLTLFNIMILMVGLATRFFQKGNKKLLS